MFAAARRSRAGEEDGGSSQDCFFGVVRQSLLSFAAFSSFVHMKASAASV